MLYKENYVSQLIRCKLCQSKLKEAKILPCGHFCTNCVTQLTKEIDQVNKEFKCDSCHDIHSVPRNGFKNWEALNEFYSKEMNLEEIYRGETSEKLKTNLKEIQKQIDDLELTLITSIDIVKELCNKLRTEINLEAQVAIKQIHDVEEELVEKVNKYENTCVSNLESDKTSENNFQDFNNELKAYHKNWSEYLKKYQINDAEMANANNSALELIARFTEEKMNLKKFIFNNKSIHFRKNQKKSEIFRFGTIDFKTIGDIDLNNLQRFNFYDILKDFDMSYSKYLNLDSYKNGKIAVVYPSNSSDMIKFVVIDKELNFCNSTVETFYFNPTYSMKLKSVKDLLVFHLYDNYNYGYMLGILDSNLDLIQAKSILYQVISLDENEDNIYCLINQPNCLMMVFDQQLNNLKSVDHFTFTNQLYYDISVGKTNQITQIACRDSKILLLISGQN